MMHECMTFSGELGSDAFMFWLHFFMASVSNERIAEDASSDECKWKKSLLVNVEANSVLSVKGSSSCACQAPTHTSESRMDSSVALLFDFMNSFKGRTIFLAALTTFKMSVVCVSNDSSAPESTRSCFAFRKRVTKGVKSFSMVFLVGSVVCTPMNVSSIKCAVSDNALTFSACPLSTFTPEEEADDAAGAVSSRIARGMATPR
mmetsp:Transcript_2942/g.8854  ORF Transcript_2942/g.8854 Transcript_2942/m.8854 type:complete len:204 (-) Transcript_2942:574-1185(-)